MSDIYKFAAMSGLRFPSARGDLMVEQLFELPLKSTVGFDLDTVAKEVNSLLKKMSDESFVEDTTKNPYKERLSISLDIVKDVIATKQEYVKAARLKADKAIERRKILDALTAKKDQNLSQASVEELEKQLAALES